MTTQDPRLTDLPPMAKLLGRQIINVASDGTVELGFEASESFVNRYGTIQGGILAAMLDSALGTSVIATLSAEQSAVTAEMNTMYFRAAKPGQIKARARVLHSGGTLAHAEADLYDAGGAHLAHATATMRILSDTK